MDIEVRPTIEQSFDEWWAEQREAHNRAVHVEELRRQRVAEYRAHQEQKRREWEARPATCSCGCKHDEHGAECSTYEFWIECDCKPNCFTTTHVGEPA